MYNAVVAKYPGKVFNYFRTLKTIPVAPNSSGVRNTHTGGVLLCGQKRLKIETYTF